MPELTTSGKSDDDVKPITDRRRTNWAWLWGGLFGIAIGISTTALNMWSNESVQDTNINYALKQIDELKSENKALRGEVGANKQHLENFSGEALDLMRRLAEQDRFRKQR